MKKLVGLPLFLILFTALFLTVVACGEAAEPPTEAPAPTAAPVATTAPAAPTEAPAEAMEESAMIANEDLVA